MFIGLTLSALIVAAIVVSLVLGLLLPLLLTPVACVLGLLLALCGRRKVLRVLGLALILIVLL